MRFLIALVTILAGLYGGYWFVGRSLVERGVEDFLADLQAQGWEVRHDGIRTRGFPSRFDTTITDLSLYHPPTGTGWEGAWFQILALSYAPNRVIAVWPRQQEIVLPGERLTIASEDMRASASVKLSTALALDTVTIDASAMVITSDLGWATEVDRALFAFRAAGPGPTDYDLFLEMTDLALPPEMLAALEQGDAVPPTIESVRVDTGLTLGQPLDRHMSDPVVLEVLTLRDTRLIWGDVELSGSGRLEADENGFAEGAITLGLTNWDPLLDLAVAGGGMMPGLARTLSRALRAVSADGQTVLAPFAFRDGQVSFAFLTLGPAPQMR
ncbi:MAG: DUF2125 domain-containing protein [Rubellimicrobium sp.]|nr:DUF2125 domain-containing protein [Rubellimicrobium sp.]